MEGIIFLISVFFIGYFLYTFIALIVLNSRAKEMNQKLDALQKKLAEIAKNGIRTSEEPGTARSMESFKQEISRPTPPPTPAKPAPLVPPVADPVLRSTPELSKPVPPKEEEIQKPVVAAASTPQARPVTPPKPPQPPKPKQPTFWEKNPDLEKFIGENLINKIAIALVVLGIGYFVKYAIEQEWINQYGRVAIGVLCGGILIGIAHYLRNSYRAFSSVLVGGGIATFYFTITLAFQVYHMFHPPAIAFSIMVLITIFTVILSIAYDRKELAVLGIIGGFGAPLMVSTGEGNYIVLFTYIAILNVGMLILAYFKRWNLINVVAIVFTILLYGGWMGSTLMKDKPFPYLGALLFATLFYLIFFLMNIINNLKNNKQFVAFEFSLLLANTVAYYSAGMYILQSLNEGLYQGLFTALLAIFNFAFAFTLFRSKKVDSNVIYLLIGLVMTFVSLAAPIQLKGNYITLFWAAEAVLLLWMSQKSGIKLMKLGSLLINLLMIVSLCMDWNNVYILSDVLQNFFINKAYLTTIAVLISQFLTLHLLKAEDERMGMGIDKKLYTGFLTIALTVLAYFGGVFELCYHISHRLAEQTENIMVIDVLLYTTVFTMVLQGLMLKFRKEKGLPLMIIFTLIQALAYMSIGYFCICGLLDSRMGGSSLSGIHYTLHYLLAISFTLMNVLNLYLIKRKYTEGSFLQRYLWVFCGIVLFVLTTEMEHFFVWSSVSNYQELYDVKHQVYKVGFPILWGLAGFAAMIVGMMKKLRSLRIISLVIFGITLLKIAIFDLKEMSQGGRIAAFILLGILLLIISFLYQRAEKRLKEEEAKSNNDTVA